MAVLALAIVSASASASLAGQLYAFGANHYGQLGSAINSGTSNPNSTPALVSLPGATGPVVRVAAGAAHSLAVTLAGQLYAFGDNRYGQLGSAINSGTSNPNSTPALVSLPGATGPVVQVAAGDTHSLAVTSTGQLYAFGDNDSGQLGRAINSGTSNPNSTPALVSLPGATGPVVQVAAGFGHSLAVTSTGQLYAFGDNQFGQLGSALNRGNFNPNSTPALVSLPGATGPVVQIAAGADHSLAVTSTGQLYAFGANGVGELGNGTGSPTPALVSLPGATGPVVRIAAGNVHSLAVTSTGQLYAFGANIFGQLGSAINNNTFNPNPIPALVSLPGATGPVVQVAAGYGDSLAVTSTGQLYAFGANDSGQLGSAINSGTGNPNPAPALVGLPAGVSVDTAARGPVASHSLVVLANLTVAADALASGTVGIPYSAKLQATGGTPPYRWTASGLPAGLGVNANTGVISGISSLAGRFQVQVTVTDADGITAARTLSLSIAPRTILPPGAPVIAGLTVSPRRVTLAGRRVGRSCVKPTRFNRRRPACRRRLRLRVEFRLNVAATVTLRLLRATNGRLVHRRCVKATHANRKHQHCTRLTAVASLTRHARAGADTLTVTHTGVSRGRYKLTVTPTRKRRTGKTQAASLTITA